MILICEDIMKDRLTGNDFTTSAEIFEWLGQFINLEQGYTPPSMRPERMQIIAAAAGHPECCAPAIHVAGSKGKGSITAMVTRILEEGGLRTARYMSPHVTEYRERITLGNAFFDEVIYVTAGNKLKQIAALLTDEKSAEYKALCDVSDGCSAEPTFFELLTLFYFLCAAEAKVDALAIETGMGGRLDPTNVVPSVASIITVIELEHTEFLGNTIQSVASEKAGIIKKDKPVILGTQNFDDALDVFKKTAAEKNSPLFYYPDIVEIKNLNVTKNGTAFQVVDKSKNFFETPLNINLGIIGEVQAQNTALAILAVKKAFPAITAQTIEKALAGFTLIARFEKLQDEPAVVVDGAHTDLSVMLCVNTWKNLYGDGGILIFGCALGKNAEAMADSLLPHFSEIVITTPGTYKQSDPKSLQQIFTNKLAQNKNIKTKISFLPDTQKAISYALSTAKKTNAPTLGIGSFYLAAEIRKFFA
jgi:dihydrofolate synthase/folylpolyglutamate synthase